MKLAIHHIQGSFSDGWIAACHDMGIEVCYVNVYAVDAVSQIKQCDAFMWDWRCELNTNWMFAKQFILALETAGVKVFPNVATCWHYDDKVGEKYLFEAMGIPVAPAWVFYDKKSAIEWARQTSYPKVFKLRGGAGAVNVKLAKNYRGAKKFIDRMFGRGYPQATGFADFATKFRKHKKSCDLWRTLFHTFPKVVRRLVMRDPLPNERGYVYFQEFIPNNEFDIRVVVIGNKAFAIRRKCRPNDFRASGSGEISYCKRDIPPICIENAFVAASTLKMQCAAFDFVCGANGKWLIIEVSYGYAPRAYDACDGYWTEDLVWYDEAVTFEKWQVELILK